MRAYVVRQGEYLSRIAARLGVDVDSIWQHPDNRELRERRTSPDILAPGDVLFVPDSPSEPTQAVSRASENRYSGRAPTVQVRVKVRAGDEPLRDASCEVQLAVPLATRTDGDGVLAFDAPTHLDEITVRFPDRQLELRLRVGHLDPIEVGSGVRSRLANLGFMLPERTPLQEQGRAFHRLHHEMIARRTARAIACFQKQQGLPETGDLDEATRDALRDAHGG